VAIVFVSRAATWAVFATIMPTDIAGWFARCGYAP
jgi:hypothetical protein